MAKSTTAPAQPAAAEAAPPAVADTTEFRIEQPASLDDAAPIAPPERTEPGEEAPPTERRLNRHDEQMKEIVARRRERIAAERAEAQAQGFADQGPTPAADAAPEAPAPGVEAGSPTPVAEQPQSGASAPAPVAEPPAPVRTHKILVRGNEITMSDDDLRRAAELGVESEARIRHANAVLEEARRLAASGQPIPGAGSSPPAASPQAPAHEPSDADRDAMRELARVILYGDDEEKVVDALLRVRQPAAPAPSVDTERLANEVWTRVDGRLGLRHALQTFGSEYAELVNDPDLATLTANHVQQLRAHYAQTQTPRSELDLFREAGNATRAAVQRWTGGGAQPNPGPNPAPPQPQPSAGPSRVAIKRNMPQAPAAAAAPQTQPAPRQQTGTDIVNWMRRTRGQAPLVGHA